MAKRILLIAGGFVVVFAALSLVAVYTYGRFVERAQGEPSYALPVADSDTLFDRRISALVSAANGESGLALVANGPDAFAARALAARGAGRSLDLMYYIWEDDLTGRLLIEEVIRAADRGVRVRLLLDDFTSSGSVAPYLAIDRHDNIEVRMFNPSRARDNALQRGLEMLLRLVSATRRMHNKAWIADGRLAIVGGRNIGDAYFDASTESSNFTDLDLVLLGPVVEQTESVFDQYWNSVVVIPITSLAGGREPNIDALQAELADTTEMETAKPYLDRVRQRVSMLAMLDDNTRIDWTDSVKVLADPPEKALREDRNNWLLNALVPVMDTAEQDLEIISPYFVPGTGGVAQLTGLAKRGIDVSVLTNSLAATDSFPLGFSGYLPYRKTLLSEGVHLYELRAHRQPTDTSLFGSGAQGLHAKAFTVDQASGFVGSFNFDPRSAALNTEMGVLFEDGDMVDRIRALFARWTAPAVCYSLTIDADNALSWQGEADGSPTTYDHDPDTSAGRRFLVWVLSLLPLESQL